MSCSTTSIVRWRGGPAACSATTTSSRNAASAPDGNAAGRCPTRALQQRHRVRFDGFGMILYRDGRDGQAFHRDTDMRWLDDTVIAILTLGARRPWLLRPRTNRHDHSPGRGATHDLAPASGDLIVMGGRTQADFEHSVPYLAARPVEPRISIQWRFAHQRGRPFQGASYRAPLNYGRR
jgi:alkylated DNA repair dioxygenase AlkB